MNDLNKHLSRFIPVIYFAWFVKKEKSHYPQSGEYGGYSCSLKVYFDVVSSLFRGSIDAMAAHHVVNISFVLNNRCG